MRFVVTAEWRENHLLRLVLGCFLVFVVLLWLTNALLFFARMSLTPASVVAFYRGSEAAFTQPRSYAVLLEISHFHLFAMGILVMTMTHLVLFVPVRVALKAWLIILTFGSALLDEASSWLVRFAHPGFAYLKIASFLSLQLTLGATIALVAWAVWVTPPSAYRGAR